MALITRVRPQTGDTAITDIVTDGQFTGTGTISLVDVGGEKAWNIGTGSLYTLAGVSKDVAGSLDGQGVTIAARIRINTLGSGSFDEILGVETEANRRVHITKSGTSLRGRIRTSAGDLLVATTSGVTFLNNVVTLVYRIKTNSATLDEGGIWIGGLARTGTLPNFASAGSNISPSTLIANPFITALNSTNYDLLDFVYFDEELSDANCSSLADDIVGYFGAVTTPITFTGTIPTQSFTNGEVVSVDLSTYFSGTETPFTFTNTGTALTGSDLTLSSAGLLSGTYNGTPITGVIVTGTDTALDTAASNAFNIETVIAYSVTCDTVTDTHSVGDVTLTYAAAGVATITSGQLHDNTDTLLANQPLDYVAIYDNTTGALVLRVTGVSTNASGVFTVSDAALIGGVTYRLDWKVTIQAQARMPSKAAV